MAGVRIIRTQSLERNRFGSLRRRNSNGISNETIVPEHQEMSFLGNGKDYRVTKVVSAQSSFRKERLSHSSVSKNVRIRSIRVIRPDSSSMPKSAGYNTCDNPLKPASPTRKTNHLFSLQNLQSHSISPTRSDSINEKIDQNSIASAGRSSSASNVNFDFNINHKQTGLSNKVDDIQAKQTDDILQKSNNMPINLSWNPAYSTDPSVIRRIEDRKRRKKCLRYFPCSRLCLCLCSLATFLLLAAIIAIIAALLSINKKTTTKTTITLPSTVSIIVTATTAITLTTTSLTTETTTTTSTTTATKPTCSISCLNQTWIDDSLLFAKWKFENNYLDEVQQYNGTGINNPVFVAGYAGQAVSFAVNASQMVSSSYIPLRNNSYTIDGWIYPTALINRPHNSICGICASIATDLCLHMTVRYTSPNYYLYHGFYSDDTNGNTKAVLINEWIHVTFTFDVTTRIQTVYHNGILLRNRTANSPFLGTTGNFQIGYIPSLTAPGTSNMFQGYIDELSVSGRVKSSCEILEQATLAARFSFDGSLPLLDQGPNSVASSGSNYVIVSGRTLNAISFTSSSPSYFQATGFLALGIPDQSFSISLWVNPTSLVGTLVHRSDSSPGTGSCASYLGFASNGSLIAQVLTNTGYVAISYSDLSLATFSHVVQTWSSMNGLRLYVNNILINTQIATSSIGNSSRINYVTLASCLNGCGSCNAGQVSPGQFIGAVDDFRVYIRELTAADVCALYAFF